jgi:superoxide reductase
MTTRRGVIAGAAALAAGGAYLGPARAAGLSTTDAVRMLAGKLIYSADAPGRWAGKEHGHVPLMRLERIADEVAVQIVTRHPMSSDHYIVKHMVLDQNFEILGETMFDFTFDYPQSHFRLKGVSGRLFAVSLCNIHDSWLAWADV